MAEKKTNNEYIDPYDYFQGYNNSIDELKNRPELVEFDKLCYEVFSSNFEPGKRLMELIIERHIMPGLVKGNNPNYATACIWAEGFKEAFRLLRQCSISHGQRIKAEKDKT